MDAEQILAFRLGRSGLAAREAGSLAEAAACPASDFSRDAALLALAARRSELTREAYEEAADRGELIVAHVIRGAIHALAPGDLALYGRALVSSDDEELGVQLGRQVRGLTDEGDIAPTAALHEVAEAVGEALRGDRALSKDDLHEELRARVDAKLRPWCKGCGSHHVAPMLWRFATTKAGVRLDSKRRYLRASPGRAPSATDVVRRFLHFYGPATPGDFAEWAAIGKAYAKRLWQAVEGELTEIGVGKRKSWLLAEDADDLDSPRQAEGVRLIPPGDPYLQKPNRPLLAAEEELRKRLFRPVASPGAVLIDGKLAGLWRVRAKGKKTEIAVEKLRRLSRAKLEPEAHGIARLRGSAELVLTVE